MNKKPTHHLMHIIPINIDDNGAAEKHIWTRIGVGWELPSGRINLVQDYVPSNTTGTIQLVAVADLPNKEERKEQA